jgi:hypothetical protein
MDCTVFVLAVECNVEREWRLEEADCSDESEPLLSRFCAGAEVDGTSG